MVSKNSIKWTKELEDRLIKIYPNTLTQDIADEFNMSLTTIRNAAFRLGLKKDKEWIRENSKHNYQFNEGAKKNQIKKGAVPPNKGKKQTEYMSKESIEKASKTRFKKGSTPHNTYEDWKEVLTKDSNGSFYWKIKVPGESRLIYKNIWLWEKNYGKIPNNHAVVFKDGNTENCVIDNLECISRAELMSRNTIHQYPEELKETIRLKNKIIKKLKIKNK